MGTGADLSVSEVKEAAPVDHDRKVAAAVVYGVMSFHREAQKSGLPWMASNAPDFCDLD